MYMRKVDTRGSRLVGVGVYDKGLYMSILIRGYVYGMGV